MSSLGLCLYTALCDVGNALELARERYAPASDDWCMLTEILGMLDQSIDVLVDSEGLSSDNSRD